MNNLRKFSTEADYSAATLNYPAVSWVTATDNVYFDKSAPTFSGLTVYYNITDISQPTELFNGGGGSGSGSGSGSGGVLPSAMVIDGTEVEPTNTYQFSTTGEHIVNYSFADNQILGAFLDGMSTGRFSTVSKVEIGDAITSIGDSAFGSCSGLTSITIGNSVTSIGEYAFNGCRSLISIVIPDSVTSIGIGAFNDCRSLTSITVDSNNTIYDSRNGCNAIIETSTNTLIQGCKTTIIPNSVTTIGMIAFNYCTSLTSIDIPSGVTSIGTNAFTYCMSLTSIDIPDSVTSIGNGVFSDCASLTSCTIGSGVTSIGQSAFNSCSNLTSITSNRTTAPTIQSSTFYNVKSGGTLTVPQGSSGYDVWMGTSNYYLGKYNWTKVEQ